MSMHSVNQLAFMYIANLNNRGLPIVLSRQYNKIRQYNHEDYEEKNAQFKLHI